MSESPSQVQNEKENEIKQKVANLRNLLNEGKLGELYDSVEKWHQTFDLIYDILRQDFLTEVTLKATFTNGAVKLILPSGFEIQITGVRDGEMKLTYAQIKEAVIENFEKILKEFILYISSKALNILRDISDTMDYLEKCSDP